MNKIYFPPMVEDHLFNYLSQKTDHGIMNVGNDLYHWFINYLHKMNFEDAMKEIVKRNWHIHLEEGGWHLVTNMHGSL